MILTESDGNWIPPVAFATRSYTFICVTVRLELYLIYSRAENLTSHVYGIQICVSIYIHVYYYY